MAMTRDCKSLALRASLVRVQPPAPELKLDPKGLILILILEKLDENRRFGRRRR